MMNHNRGERISLLKDTAINIVELDNDSSSSQTSNSSVSSHARKSKKRPSDPRPQKIQKKFKAVQRTSSHKSLVSKASGRQESFSTKKRRQKSMKLTGQQKPQDRDSSQSARSISGSSSKNSVKFIKKKHSNDADSQSNKNSRTNSRFGTSNNLGIDLISKDIISISSDNSSQEVTVRSNESRAFFQEMEDEANRIRKEKKIEECARQLPMKEVMDQLNLEYDHFDKDSNCQMFIDKENCAVMTGQDSESEDSADEEIVRRSIISSIVCGKHHRNAKKQNLQRITKVLEQPSNKRSSEMIDSIMPLFKEFDAIKKIKDMNADGQKPIPRAFYQKLLQNSWIERYKRGDMILKQGDVGDNFYIIIEGSVSFLVNNPEKSKALIQFDEQMQEKEKADLKSNKTKGFPSSLSNQNSLAYSTSKLSKQSRVITGEGKFNDELEKQMEIQCVGKVKHATIEPRSLTPAQMIRPHSKVSSKSKRDLNQLDKSKKDSDLITRMVMSEIRRHHRGQMFGDIAIRTLDQRRTGSVRALRDCVLMTMAGKDFQKYFSTIMDKMDDERIEFLRQTTIFKSWSKANCRSFMGFIKSVEYRKGQSVILQGFSKPCLFLVKRGSVQLRIRAKKPYSDKDAQADLLQEEKFKLKDNVNGIIRNTKESMDAQNCMIEGDGTGLMGAHPDWPQIPRSHIYYKQRMDQNYQNRTKNQLKRRLLQSGSPSHKNDFNALQRREYDVMDHSFVEIVSGQTFNEEGILLHNKFPSQYTAVVTSDSATIEVINEIQLQRRLEMLPATQVELLKVMQHKAHLVHQFMQIQSTWSLTNADQYSRFYVSIFDHNSPLTIPMRKLQKTDDAAPTSDDKQKVATTKQEESSMSYHKQAIITQNKAQDETKDFYQSLNKKTPVDELMTDQNGAIRREQLLQRNLQLLNAKVDDMNQIEQAVNVGPQKRTWMPQMANKKRYAQVQRVVSPLTKKRPETTITGVQIPSDVFFNETLSGANNKIGSNPSGGHRKRPKSSITGHNYGNKPSEKAASRAIEKYERRLNAVSNVQGGGALIHGQTYDMRAVIREIVKGYPEVARQKAIHKREQQILERDENGKLKHRTTDMLFDESYDGKESNFERQLYQAFEESPDPEQLIKILKRKLTMGDREMGTQQAKYLDEILGREPIKQFILYARKSYYSNHVFDQIERVGNRFGNEAEVYKNDKGFQAKAKAKQLKAEKPVKNSYFTQRLQQKQQEALIYQTQNQRKLENQQTHIYQKQSQRTNPYGLQASQHKIEINPMLQDARCAHNKTGFSRDNQDSRHQEDSKGFQPIITEPISVNISQSIDMKTALLQCLTSPNQQEPQLESTKVIAHGQALSSNASIKDTARITYHCASENTFEERGDTHTLNDYLKKIEAEEIIELPLPKKDVLATHRREVSVPPETSTQNPVEVNIFNGISSLGVPGPTLNARKSNSRPQTSLIHRRNLLQGSQLSSTDDIAIGIGSLLGNALQAAAQTLPEEQAQAQITQQLQNRPYRNLSKMQTRNQNAIRTQQIARKTTEQSFVSQQSTRGTFSQMTILNARQRANKAQTRNVGSAQGIQTSSDATYMKHQQQSSQGGALSSCRRGTDLSSRLTNSQLGQMQALTALKFSRQQNRAQTTTSISAFMDTKPKKVTMRVASLRGQAR